jgi:hypothetical protein
MPGRVTVAAPADVGAGVTGFVPAGAAAACFDAAGVAALVDAAGLAELDELAELDGLDELDGLAELEAAGGVVTDTAVVALGVPGRAGLALAVAVRLTDVPPAVPDETVI